MFLSVFRTVISCHLHRVAFGRTSPFCVVVALHLAFIERTHNRNTSTFPPIPHVYTPSSRITSDPYFELVGPLQPSVQSRARRSTVHMTKKNITLTLRNDVVSARKE